MKENEKTGKDWGAILEEAASEELGLDEQVDSEIKGIEHPDYAALEAQLTAAEQKAHENLELALRAKSDLENGLRRAEQQIINATKTANEKLIKELLPVVDSLEQALLAVDANDTALAAMREGVDLTLKMFVSSLGKMGVQQLDPQGLPFDPNRHEAMTSQPDDAVAPNTVVAVFQKGYVLHERVIRPARVVVSKKTEN